MRTSLPESCLQCSTGCLDGFRLTVSIRNLPCAPPVCTTKALGSDVPHTGYRSVFNMHIFTLSGCTQLLYGDYGRGLETDRREILAVNNVIIWTWTWKLVKQPSKTIYIFSFKFIIILVKNPVVVSKQPFDHVVPNKSIPHNLSTIIQAIVWMMIVPSISITQSVFGTEKHGLCPVSCQQLLPISLNHELFSEVIK